MTNVKETDAAGEFWNVDDLAHLIEGDHLNQRVQTKLPQCLSIGDLFRLEPGEALPWHQTISSCSKRSRFWLLPPKRTVDCARGRAMLLGVNGLRGHRLDDAARET